MHDRRRGIIEMTAAMVISGSIGLFVVLADLPVWVIVFWRCVFAAAALVVVCAVSGHFKHSVSRRALLLSIAGGVAIVLNWLLLFAALPRASIAIATVVYNVQRFILIGFGALFLGERVAVAKIYWLSLAFVGLILVVQLGAQDVSSDWTYLSGTFMAVGAAFFWAVASILTKQLVGTPPQLIALIQVCVGIVVLGPAVPFSSFPTGAGAWLSLLSVGLVHTAFVYILMYDAIHRLPTVLQGALSFLYPIVAVALDAMVLNHELSKAQLVGMAAILLAAAGASGLLPFNGKRQCVENSV